MTVLDSGGVSTSSTDEQRSADKVVDVLIVGAGPVGLYGAYYAGVRGLSVGVVDSLSQVGGQVSAMYPEKQIFDVGGFASVLGRDLVAGLFEQAASAHPTYLLDQEAQTLDRREDGRLRVVTSNGNVVDCGAVVVTGGIGTFSPRQLPAGEDFLGRGLEYFVTDVEGYAGRDVLIVGGGDSAFDWCQMLEPLASTVTLVHRRERFRAQAGTVEKVRDSSVRIITNAEVAALSGDGTVQGAAVAVRGEPAPLDVVCQRVVAALGFKASLGPMREWGVQMHDNRHLVVDSAMRTNLPGVFGAGDVVEYDGKVRLIATGFGEVATAVNNAAVHIDPEAHLFPGHTSEMPRPASTPA